MPLGCSCGAFFSYSASSRFVFRSLWAPRSPSTSSLPVWAVNWLPPGSPKATPGKQYVHFYTKIHDFAMPFIFQKWQLRVPRGPPRPPYWAPRSPKRSSGAPQGIPQELSVEALAPQSLPPDHLQKHLRLPQATQGIPRSLQGYLRTTPSLNSPQGPTRDPKGPQSDVQRCPETSKDTRSNRKKPRKRSLQQ